jgi:3-oxoacyl-[acyl-carrier-protein] synthase-3
MYRNIDIIGTGSYLPEGRLCNEQLAHRLGIRRDWIVRRTGIHQRHIAAPDQATSDLAIAAARQAMGSARIKPSEIDLIIVATSSADVLIPSTACRVQQQLHAASAAAFDLNAACSGFLYGLASAAASIQSGQAETVLLIASETRSRFVNPQDPHTAVLYGDGAGAVILTHCENPKRSVLYISLGADGRGWEVLSIPAGGSRQPPSLQTVEQALHFIRWDSSRLIRSVTRGMVRLIFDTLDQNDIFPEEVDVIIPHQMNLRIIKSIAEQTGIGMNKFYTNLQHCGNTSAASIPIALDEAFRAGKIRPGYRVLLVAFGAGFTWGATLIRW